MQPILTPDSFRLNSELFQFQLVCTSLSDAVKTADLIVIPKGVEHKPYARSECHAMIVEPRGVVNTGDTGGPLTADNDVWI